MHETSIAPPGFELLAEDEPWDPARHLEIVEPANVVLLDEWGAEAAGTDGALPARDHLAVSLPQRRRRRDAAADLRRPRAVRGR